MPPNLFIFLDNVFFFFRGSHIMTLINTEYQGFTRKLGELCSFVLENVKNIPRLNNLDLAAFRILPADGNEMT